LNNLTRFKMVKERQAKSVPTESMIKALRGLCEDKRNTVFVVSGKERHSLTETLGNIPNLGMAAEHGMFISWPMSKGGRRRWDTLVPQMDRTWRSLAVNIMEVYTSRTHGSYIEQTEMKVLWQYRDADTEFGSLQAKELEDHLAKYLRGFPVDILHGGVEEGGYVEVRPKGVNKGVLAMHVLRRYPDIAQKDRVDFALVLGDDHCDEPMLSVMRQIGRRFIGFRRAANGEDPLPPMSATSIQRVDVSMCDNFVSTDLEVFTATVGKKPSAAANYLDDVESVQELLDGLVKMSTRELRYHSSIDLRSNSTIEPNRFLQRSNADTNSSFRRTMSMSVLPGRPTSAPMPEPVKVADIPSFLPLPEPDDADCDEDNIMFF
jgi:trehalose 6-phosphate synthase/phosphatase